MFGINLEERLMAILADKSMSAIEINREARRRFGFFHGLWNGSLFPLLRALEIEGKICSEWKPGPEPRTPLYRKAELSKQSHTAV